MSRSTPPRDTALADATRAQEAAPAAGRRVRLPFSLTTVDSLSEGKFRWFLGSMFLGFTASFVHQFLAGWVVFELTGSFAALGLMSLAQGSAGLVLSLTGGVLADRVRSKRRLVQLGQSVSAVTVLALALLVANDGLQVAHVIVGVAIVSGSHTLTMPSRQALTPELVGMGRLMNAMALYTFGQNSARLLMPGIAGWLVGALSSAGSIDGAMYVYALSGLLYVGALLALARVRVEDRGRPPAGAAFAELLGGFRYVLRTPTMRMLLGYNTLVAMFAVTLTVLLPGFAKEVLGTGASQLGLLYSALGVGAVVGSLIVASLPSRRRGLLLLLSVAFLGVTLLTFAISTWYWLSVAIIVVVGLSQAGYLSISNVLIQAYVDDEYRGRVLSIYMMEFSLMALGGVVIGLLASAAGPRVAVGTAAVALVALSLPTLALFARFRRLD